MPEVERAGRHLSTSSSVSDAGTTGSDIPTSSKTASAIEIPHIASRTIPGILSKHNKKALDWGPHGLLAYGCNFTVVIVDPVAVQHAQCLNKHKAAVTRVKWQNNRKSTSLTNPSRMLLASSDLVGNILVWDAHSIQPIAAFQDGNKPILGLEWVPHFDETENFVAALHPPYSLIIWDALSGNKVWKKSYTESLIALDFDPFSATSLAFLSNDCILLVDDFAAHRTPSGNGRKFFLSPLTAGTQAAQSEAENQKAQGGKKTGVKFRKKMLEFVTGELKPINKSQDEDNGSDCLQILYHRSMRNWLLLVYSREVVVLDLQLCVTLAFMALEPSSSPLVQIISCREPDLLYCLHESGLVSVRGKRLISGSNGNAGDRRKSGRISMDRNAPPELYYETKCQGDVVRTTKHQKVACFVSHPFTESKIGLLLTNGVIIMAELLARSGDDENSNQRKASQTYDLVDYGYLSGMSAFNQVCRMCPPVTTKNWQAYRPYLAVGSQNGTISVVNASSGVVEKEFASHSFPVRGIEWTGLQSFLSYAWGSNTSTPAGTPVNAQVSVANELVLTTIGTGETVRLRGDRGDEEPIKLIRVSHLKQYALVGFQEKPFELWDLRSLNPLRSLPAKLQLNICSLEWSPVNNHKFGPKHSVSGYQLSALLLKPHLTPPTSPDSIPAVFNDAGPKDVPGVLEHFILTDPIGNMWHFGVEAQGLKDLQKYANEPALRNSTCCAWKSDLVVWGSNEPSLTLLDVKSKTFTALPLPKPFTPPALRLRFAPGRGNYKVLIMHPEGLEVWDLKEMKPFSHLVTPVDMVQILDADWAASDQVVAITADGCVRIIRVDFKQPACSPLEEYERPDPLACPGLLPNRVLLSMEALLQLYLSWEDPSASLLSFHGIRAFDVLKNQLALIPDSARRVLNHFHGDIPVRCLVTSLITGDIWGFHFWTVAKHYLERARAERGNSKQSVRPLSTSFDILRDGESFKDLQVQNLQLQEGRGCSTDLAVKIAENGMLLKQWSYASRLFMESDSHRPDYYRDMLRVCLVSSLKDNKEAQSTVKMVATNLIANDQLWEGVQLLVLIDKGLDACRYLISHRRWDAGVWLAKSILCFEEAREILCKYGDHLSDNGQKARASLVFVSAQRWDRAIDMLMDLGQVSRAAMLLFACRQYGFSTQPEGGENTKVERIVIDAYRQFLADVGFTSCDSLLPSYA